MLSIIMKPLKNKTPCLLVRHKYRHTNHHAAASLSFKFVPPCASQRGTPRHERDATHGEDHGPAMPIAHKAHARDGTRGGVRGGLRRSGRRHRVVVGEAPWGVMELSETQQPPPENNEARLPATRRGGARARKPRRRRRLVARLAALVVNVTGVNEHEGNEDDADATTEGGRGGGGGEGGDAPLIFRSQPPTPTPMGEHPRPRAMKKVPPHFGNNPESGEVF